MPKPPYDKDAANLVTDSHGFPIGIATRWNPCGVGEIVVQFFAGEASSMFASELNFPNGRDRAYEYLNAREP